MFDLRSSRVWMTVALVAAASHVSAQPAEPAPAPPPTDPASEAGEDLGDIEAALAADAAAEAQAAPPTPSTAAALAAIMNPDLAFIVDVAAAWFSDDAPLQTGGHDPSKNGFNLQQLEMSVGKAVDPYFRFDANIVFAQFGVEVEEAYATTLALPASLQLRVGQFLTQFGRINPTHPHVWDFTDQPFAIGRVFGGEGNRGLGVELSWLTPLPWYVEVIGSVTDPVGEGTARSFFGPVDLPLETPLDVQSTLAVKQFFELSHDWSLQSGVSLATGPNPTGHANRTDVWGAFAYLKWRPITEASHQLVAVQTEWLLRRRQVPHDLLRDVSGYAYVLWRFSRRWGMAARYEYGSPATGDVADYLDPEWIAARQRITGNLTFWPTEFSRVRLQGSVDRPGWRDPIWAGFLSMEFSVGAHGAHAF